MKQQNRPWNVKKSVINIIPAVLSIILFTILSTNSVLALGVAPSRQNFDFEPGKVISGELTIINNEGFDLRAGLYASGDLAESVQFEQSLIDIPAEVETIKVPYKITLPKGSQNPGTHEIELVIRQFPKEASEGTQISAQMAVISQVMVKVPYPGIYAEGKLFISGAEDLETPVTFTTMIYNFGKATIADANVEVDIFGPTWELVGEANSEHSRINSQQEIRLDSLWEPDVSKGTYRAVANVFYDGKSFKIEKTFDLGTFMIDISDIIVQKFRLGDVAKFDIELYNSWNTEIKDVTVELFVHDKDGKEMTHFETGSVDIPAQNKEVVEAYWYTEGVSPGIYDVKALVHYQGKVTEKDFQFEVDINKITQIGAVGHAILSEDELSEVKTQGLIIFFIILIVIILIVMNVVWFYVMNKKLSEKNGTNKPTNPQKNNAGEQK